MRAVDTNVLVRLITRDEARQVTAAERFVESGAWVSILALTEAIWVLESVYGFEANDLAGAIQMLLNHEQLAMQNPEVVSAALDLFRQRPSLEFSDCLMLESARKAGHLPLGTFDRRLGTMDGAQKL